MSKNPNPSADAIFAAKFGSALARLAREVGEPLKYEVAPKHFQSLLTIPEKYKYHHQLNGIQSLLTGSLTYGDEVEHLATLEIPRLFPELNGRINLPPDSLIELSSQIRISEEVIAWNEVGFLLELWSSHWEVLGHMMKPSLTKIMDIIHRNSRFESSSQLRADEMPSASALCKTLESSLKQILSLSYEARGILGGVSEEAITRALKTYSREQSESSADQLVEVIAETVIDNSHGRLPSFRYCLARIIWCLENLRDDEQPVSSIQRTPESSPAPELSERVKRHASEEAFVLE